MSLLIIYALVTLCFVSLVNFTKSRVLRAKKKYPRGPFGLPIVGHLPFYGIYPPHTFLKWWKQYGDVFSIRLGNWNAVVVNGLPLIREVTQHPKNAFSGRPNFVTMEVLADINGEVPFAFGNFTPAYVKQHTIAAKSLRLFTSGRPEVIEELVVSETNLFIDQMIKSSGTVPGFVESAVQTLTVRFMYQLLYGVGVNVDGDRHVKLIIDYLNEFDEFTANGSVIDVLPWLRFLMPWKLTWLRKMRTKFIRIQDEQIDAHYETLTSDVIRDLTDAILTYAADDALNRDRINNILSDFLAVGVDTTNRTITWLLLYVTAFPEVQKKVHAELDDVVKGRRVSLKDKTNLPYIEAVYLEVSRIVTQVPFSVPHCAIMDGKMGDYDVDKETVVILNLHSVHHDESFGGDPENFRPERFLNSVNSLDMEKCSHVIPFGIGRRHCLGEALAKMNVFMSFATIMQRCELIKPGNEELDLAPIPGLVNQAHDFRVLIKDRQ